MSAVERAAEAFAEQKASLSTVEGIDHDMLRAMWKANAMEVLAFALPGLTPFNLDRQRDPKYFGVLWPGGHVTIYDNEATRDAWMAAAHTGTPIVVHDSRTREGARNVFDD